ncbi:MAG: hemerythrin domain-containing protein [Steroidobacteraceae bacterium]
MATVAQPRQSAAAGRKNDAEALLRSDHRRVNGLFRQFESAEGPLRKHELTRKICDELIVHSRLEEEIFYPACRARDVQDDVLDEAQVEHDTLKFLVSDLMERAPASSFYDAKVAVLAAYVKHHVKEEEKPGSGIFARARKAGVDMAALGARIEERKQQLVAQAEAGTIGTPVLRSIGGYGSRSRNGDDDYVRGGGPSRFGNPRLDEQNRFTADDEKGAG